MKPVLPLKFVDTQILDDEGTPLATALSPEIACWLCETVNLIGGLPDVEGEQFDDEDFS